MSIFSFIGEIFKPAADLVDNLHTSDEEKLKLQNAFVKMQNEASGKLLEFEAKLVEAQSKIITAEAQGQSWLQRNWRPLTMLVFNGLLVSYWLGKMPPNMTQETINNLFDLLKLGIGGYICARSAEKVVPKITEVLKK